MYAYARSAGALDDEHNCLRAIWINEFLCSRVRRDFDTSVDADLVRLKRNERVSNCSNVTLGWFRSMCDPYRTLGRSVSARYACPRYRCWSKLCRVPILRAQSEGWVTQTISSAMLPRAERLLMFSFVVVFLLKSLIICAYIRIYNECQDQVSTT